MATSSFIKVDGPLMSLELNKDKNKAAVAGRRTFKIFSVDDGTFIEDLDLRGTDTVNLNYSFTDVSWSSKEDHLLATSATNGAVITWNLNKNHHSKQDRVFLDHKRTVNRVGFHSFEPWLITCSQDSTVRCFDLRTRDSGRIYKSNTESIRDVQFNPHSLNTFAAVSENGGLQLWDLRRQDKFFMQYAAHAEPIFSCDWHPDCQWIATGSRDKSIKVWDVTPSKPVLKYVVNTIASVGRVKWRPMRKYQLASTALVVDWNVNVWDLKRPYIPFACFSGHRDIVTDIAWRTDPKSIVSVGRDYLLHYHVMSDALRPADLANPQAVSVSCTGDIVFSHRFSSNTATKAIKILVPTLLRRSTPSKAEFSQNTSQLNIFNMNNQLKPDEATDYFIQFAERYLLAGKPLAEMCEHNSSVAKNLGKYNISFLWEVIKQIFSTNFFEGEEILINDDTESIVAEREETDEESEIPTELAVALQIDDELPELLSYDPKPQLEEMITDPPYITVGDFVFGDKEMDPLSLDYDNCENLCLGVNGVFTDKFDLDENDWNLPTEAFALRHEIKESSPPPELLPSTLGPFYPEGKEMELGDCSLLEGGFFTTENDIRISSVKFVKSSKDHVPLHVKWSQKLPRWNSSELIAATLQHHANDGDFQTAVCVLLVLGEKRRYILKTSSVDEVVQEQWLLSYIDTLNRYKLWNIATEVIQLSWLSTVSQLNQHSTTMRTACGKCRRALVRSGWLCDRCHSTSSSVCSICHEVVKGLFLWCQGCTHGGHLVHIRSWLRENRVCPAGCGHTCEY